MRSEISFYQTDFVKMLKFIKSILLGSLAAKDYVKSYQIAL